MNIICVVCEITTSPTWWKRCPKHTTEQGPDVVCQPCASKCLQSKEVVKKGEV